MIRKPAFYLAVLLCTSLSAPWLHSQTQSVDAEGHQWWQHAVFYEIYPRSFADSNNDGIGDLNGITSKLDYLKKLGVDAIWITPCFPSPQVDFGYDVSDYENIDPMYGTLADFDRMASEAKQRDVRIILDFVLNHTSDQHNWFIDSKSSKTAEHRDWYIWKDPKPGGGVPNNWISGFGGSTWKLDPTTNQYYYHYFYAEQPDLNWHNPAVEKAMFDSNRFWYKRGVSGFRLDAVDTLFEDPDLRDNPILPGTSDHGDPNMANTYNTKLPEVHDVLKRLRKVADESNAVLIGETWTRDAAELKQYYGDHSDELQMPMDLMFAVVDRVSAPAFRAQIAAADSSGGWPVYLVSNHDKTRSYNRYGDGKHNDEIAKLIAGLYLTLRGTPIMYYGEELGMENNDPKRKEDVKDPVGRVGWPKDKGRDGERTPMQWSTATNAGFSTAKPWLPVPASYKTHNVETEEKDPRSVLTFYQKLLALRHQDRALLDGEYLPLNQNDPNVLAYIRHYKDEYVLVALNMSGSAQKVSLDLSPAQLSSAKAEVLLTTSQKPQSTMAPLQIEPFGVYIARLTK